MTKRLIGIDIAPRSLRVAVLSSERGSISLVSVMEIPRDDSPESLNALHELSAGGFGLGDRLVACLPAGAAFIRRLNFPFTDRRKIAAALPYELGTQLPVSLDDYTLAMQSPQKDPGGASVMAAAVSTAALGDFLRPFDAANIPLHFLDVAPFAYVAGLKDLVRDGLLACLSEQEFCLALVSAGQIVDFRQMPRAASQSIAQQARSLGREAMALQRSAKQTGPMPLYLIGPCATAEFATELTGPHDRVELLSIALGDAQVEAPFVPAAALALRAADTGRSTGFNLRQGRFALKGEWAGLRRALYLAAALAGLALLTLGTAMGVKYVTRSSQAAALQEEMVGLYREAFPDATTVVNVPLQLQSAIRALQDELGLIDQEAPSPIKLLRALSDLPDDLTIDLDDFSMERNEVRIAGRTSSFDAVNRMAERVRQSPFFTKVDVSEAKMNITGQEVVFRMTLQTGDKGVRQ